MLRNRKLLFSAVGISVMLLSFVELWVMISLLGMTAWVAYAIQTFLSVELNFLGNWLLTYRDRRTENSVWRSLLLFHATRVFTIPFNQLLFTIQVMWLGGWIRSLDVAWLTELLGDGVPYLLANMVCIGTTTVLNYVAGDKLAFGGKWARKKVVQPVTHATPSVLLPKALPTVSIVVPVKGDSVVSTLDALAQQNYPASFEVILVGDIGDPALTEARLFNVPFVLRTIEVQVESSGRDSNAKRKRGLEEAHGDILSVLDSDVLPAANWLSQVVSQLTVGGKQAVAGPLSGLGDTFWDRYIDKNRVGSKTPRMAQAYTVTSSNAHRCKLPVTANFACVRAVIELAGYPDPRFTRSYEDYSWFATMLKHGVSIYCDPALVTPRYHRSGLKALLNEYKRSGMGCADFIVVHAHSRFARKRIRQVVATLLTGLAVLVGSIMQPWLPAALLVAIVPLMLHSMFQVRHVTGLVFPLISLLFAARFLQGVLARFVKYGWQFPVESRIVAENWVTEPSVTFYAVN